MSKVKLFIVCSGLGTINRGYESFARECFEVLKKDERLDTYLFKGGGENTEREKKRWNLKRYHWLTKSISKITGLDSYKLEQLTYFLMFIPDLFWRKPDVILVSDFHLSTYLWHLRKFLNLKYKILFSNGAPNGPPFNRCDHVQQLLPVHYQTAIKGGTSADMQSIIPYGVDTPKKLNTDINFKKNIRKEIGIPEDAFVVISVAAVNKSQKRMDYLIKEFAELNISNSYLILLGQLDEEANEIIQLANNKLPKGNFKICSVNQDQVNKYYQSADVFVLASLSEGLPRVTIEAMSYGLPVLIHDYTIAREILKNWGYFADFSIQGSLKSLIEKFYNENMDSVDLRIGRNLYIYENFSWEVLKEKYTYMILQTFSS